MAKVAVGVDIGGTNLKFGLVTEKGLVIARKRKSTKASEGPAKVIGRIRQGVSELAEKAHEVGHRLAGIGLGTPGIISAADGVVRLCPNMPGWVDIPLAALAGQGMDAPVYIENDANAYALGEHWQGAGRGTGSMVCLTLGTGVGGGIVIGGKVWHGADGMAGEVGHLTVNPKGPLCGCGNHGCLERYSSATAVVEMAVESLLKGSASSLAGLYRENPSALTARRIMEAARSGDRLSLKVYNMAGVYLGIAIADMINLLNIERVVIGGGMAGAWELFAGPMNSEISKRAFRIPAERCSVVRGELGDDAGIIGSASLAFKGRKA